MALKSDATKNQRLISTEATFLDASLS